MLPQASSSLLNKISSRVESFSAIMRPKRRVAFAAIPICTDAATGIRRYFVGKDYRRCRDPASKLFAATGRGYEDVDPSS